MIGLQLGTFSQFQGNQKPIDSFIHFVKRLNSKWIILKGYKSFLTYFPDCPVWKLFERSLK